jgi:hypothetical protein
MVSQNRADEKQSLTAVLTKIKTLQVIQDHIVLGLHKWESGQPIRPPSCGSVAPIDMLLTNAFVEQTTIGWDDFVKGCITSSWRSVYEALSTLKRPTEASRLWSKQLIHAIWDYSKRLWAFQNTTLHSQDVHDRRLKDKEKLRSQVEEMFDRHANDPFFIPQPMNHLFNKPIQYVLSLDRDAIVCWTKSVEEANLSRVHMESVSKDSILQFLRPCRTKGTDHIEGVSPKDSYIQPHSKQSMSNVVTGPVQPSPTYISHPFSPVTERKMADLPSVSLQQCCKPKDTSTITKKSKKKRAGRHRVSRPKGRILQYTKRITSRRQADYDSIP